MQVLDSHFEVNHFKINIGPIHPSIHPSIQLPTTYLGQGHEKGLEPIPCWVECASVTHTIQVVIEVPASRSACNCIPRGRWRSVAHLRGSTLCWYLLECTSFDHRSVFNQVKGTFEIFKSKQTRRHDFLSPFC